uniref:T-cell receptor alpha/delta variable 14.0 n=1 Tax=Pygocentrus nattereri TaxID=42514 RepID=A0AAR2LZG5_PYGNA
RMKCIIQLLLLKETFQVSEGDSVSLSCSYSSSNVYNILWYRQYPSSKLDFLLYIFESGDLSDPLPPGFSARIENERVDLLISSAKLSDSALYYCALRPTVTRSPASLYKN